VTLPDPCPRCGFDGRSLTPAELLVTVRSLGRRWRSILVRDDDVATTRPPDGGPAAAELAAEVVAALAGAAEGVRVRGLSDDRPVPPDPPPAAMATGDEVTAAANALAAAVERVDADHLAAVLPEARRGAHAGVHHLRPAMAAVEAVVAARD